MTADDGPALSALAARLKEATRTAGSRKAAAEMADISVAQWDRYLAGNASPPFLAIARLATRAGLSLDWIAYGKETRGASPIDEGLLSAIIKEIEVEALRRGTRPPPDKYGDLVAHVYAVVSAMEADDRRKAGPEVVRRAFRLAS